MLHAFQWDLARQLESRDHLLALLPRYADWGYDRLYLHLEDAVDYPSLPGLARADAYAWVDLEMIVRTAAECGIRTVPIANLLGHTQYVIKHPYWQDLNELRDLSTGEALPTGQICPLHPRIADLVARLFTDLAPLCTAGEIHVGLDESFHLGKHPRSQAEVAEVGLAAHFARHVTRLHAAAALHGLRLGLWADMLALLPEAIPLLPARSGLAAYDWYYYPFGREPRLELRNFAPYDVAPALRAAGIDYWACPMNGAFRHESAPVWTDRLQNLACWHRRALATGAAGYLVTSWEPHRLAFPATTLVDAAAATLWLDPGAADDPAVLLAAGLRRYAAGGGGRLVPATATTTATATVTATAAPVIAPVLPGAAALARRLLATDERAFVGNSRWEMNNAWALVASRRDSPAPFARAARQLQRLAAHPCFRPVRGPREAGRPMPLALAPGAAGGPASADNGDVAGKPVSLAFLGSTVRFQAYIAWREVFVRESAARIYRLRRLLARGGLVTGDAVSARSVAEVARVLAHARDGCADHAARLRTARWDARAMWSTSRALEAFGMSPNARLLAADVARLRALRAWFLAAGRDAGRARLASPVCGRWTLCFTLHHFAPAHQKIVVEQEAPDGTWRELYSRVLIEFRAEAARANTPKLRFEIAVPIDDPNAPLRIAARCLGEFAVSHVELTDGLTTRAHRPQRVRHWLGCPAPTSGWPRIDWQTNVSEWVPDLR